MLRKGKVGGLEGFPSSPGGRNWDKRREEVKEGRTQTEPVKNLEKRRNQELVQELKTLYGEQNCMGSANKSPPKDYDGEVSNEEREIILKVDEAVVKSSKPAIYIVGLEQNKKSIRQSLCSKEFVEPEVKECERHNIPQILQSKLENPDKDKEDEREDKGNGGTCVGVSLPECPPDNKKTKKQITQKGEKILCKSEDGKRGRIKNKEHHNEKSNTNEEFGKTQLLDGNDNFSDNKVPSNEASNGFATNREEPNSNGLSVFPGKEAQQLVYSDKDKEDGLGLMEHKLVIEGEISATILISIATILIIVVTILLLLIITNWSLKVHARLSFPTSLTR